MKTQTNEQQVGGNHYERFKIEPVKVFVAFRFNWFQGEILKYVSRFLYKNGEQDLNKAIHISQMAVDLKVVSGPRRTINFQRLVSKKKNLLDLVDDYISQFDYQEYMSILIIGIIEENYEFVKTQIVELKKKYYG